MNELDTPYVHYLIRDRILIATYKKGIKINLTIAKKIVKDRLSFTGNNLMVALVYNHGILSMDKEARDFFSSPAANVGLKAGAIIQNNAFTSILGNFFLTVNKPNIPARLFTKEEPAIRWLEKFLS